MHIEVQVALNFVISYLYNKLPRRRVNIFGEELEKALKTKFQGHWYPEKPLKGSAYRCLKIDPVDAVLNRAARESGICIYDILEYLPQEMAIWIDPGEVSYRIGEKGSVKILFSELEDLYDDYSADREVTRTFNPEAQCFRPIESYGPYFGGFSLIPNKSTSPFGFQPVSTFYPNPMNGYCGSSMSSLSASSTSTPIPFRGSPSPIPTFLPRTTAPLTFTTATFAQTKFGSTKLKTSSKRANRMSPTEFSNYIKQRAMQQQMHQQAIQNAMTGRALSPNAQSFQGPPDNYYYHHGQAHFQPQYAQRNIYDNTQYMPDMYNKYPGWDNYHPQYVAPQPNQQAMAYNGNVNMNAQQVNNHNHNNNNNNNGNNGNNKQDGAKNNGSGASYNSKQYQHLLLAN